MTRISKFEYVYSSTDFKVCFRVLSELYVGITTDIKEKPTILSIKRH